MVISNDMPDRWYSTKEICAYLGMSNNELLTHEGNESIEHGFYRSEQLSLL